MSGCNVGGTDLRTPDGVALTERRMRFAKKWFDVSVVVSGAGQPTSEQERSQILDVHFGTSAMLHVSLGITIALERAKDPLKNAEAMLALMSNVDHPNVRLNFDTGNIAYYNQGANPVDELGKVAHFVRNVHVKDNRGGFEDWYFPAVGDGGAVDFQAVREILDADGFLRPLYDRDRRDRRRDRTRARAARDESSAALSI